MTAEQQAPFGSGFGYRSTAADVLKGIDLDARRAAEMALRMGVPKTNIREVKNEQVTREGLSAALKALSARIAKDDRVFIYYSGHGTQVVNRFGRPGCSEGLATYEGYAYFDADLRSDLDLLGKVCTTPAETAVVA